MVLTLPPMRAPSLTLAPSEVELEFGKYKLVAFLDRGGTADVYLASMPGPAGFSKLVALKRLREEYRGDIAARRMFLAEARLAAMLTHPNIVQTIDVGEIGDAPYIVMEYLEGQPLHKILERAVDRDVAMPLAVPMRIVAAILDALHYSHELADIDGSALGIVHHDISPHNIFVTYTGQIKLLDFGIAWISALEPRSNELQGRPAYMAPEVAFGGIIDRRADIFSIGVVLWELFARRRMLRARSNEETLEVLRAGNYPLLSSVARGVPERLDMSLARATHFDPAMRYPTAADMRKELESIVDSRGTRASEDDIRQFINMLFEQEREHTRDRVRMRALTLRQRMIIANVVENAEVRGQSMRAPHTAPMDRAMIRGAMASAHPDSWSPPALPPPPVHGAPIQTGASRTAVMVTVALLTLSVLVAALIAVVLMRR